MTAVNLPHEVLLSIFQYLDVEDLCRLSRVCKLWKKVSNDRSLWKEVSLKKELKVGPLKKLLYHHAATDALQRLEIKGPLKLRIYPKGSAITDKCIELLNERCPNLTTLVLESYNLEQITYLPKNLKHLALVKCNTPLDGFAGHLVHKFSELKSLDLTNSTKVGSKDLTSLSSYTSITQLNLDGCYRLSASFLQAYLTLEFLSQLEKLSIVGITMNDADALINVLSSPKMSMLKVLRTCELMPWEYLPITLQALIIIGSKEDAKLTSEKSFYFEKGLVKLKNLKLLKFSRLTLEEPERIKHHLPINCQMNIEDDSNFRPIFDLYNNALT